MTEQRWPLLSLVGGDVFFWAMKRELIRNVGNAREENVHKGHDNNQDLTIFWGHINRIHNIHLHLH
ncbi:hypothetical protein AtNW77_Chr1g0012661 [Arabidopsis thaliana]|jgi:hypothetical protein|uniref:Uncharacterized protein n=4 Tax=Arabidopsis TaxID=3701 RepID=A0A654E8V3_ARATH|nr:uncharacterized protein AT1G11684 [Arabidopsis thaliana]KAG7596698.1 hypothetical protein ISN44_As06g011290 [Arabidopsis suecica]KAG7645969.1 hypothetical protein ISN45_At01g011550 [Arabidopsis thaliana x Arabidopsis arenosa]AEE28770.1 hypothetical protein AT1G11684 [Arabidopsis thaliana]CAA0192317.1 unnamed protein product [Arabidopsis thaliana]VYS45769.1 unnamed protein product [Arabidopsis thaliana]|eukprot:NP_001117271.1 hypothetical protein AT1G11684 [Arabidopsis thaliana]